MSDEQEQKKPKAKGGRPSKFEPGFCDRVRELGAEGLSKYQIAARLGVSKGTLFNWVDAHPEFKHAMEEAQDLSQAWWEDCGMAALRLGSKDFCAQAFVFQMKNRFRDYRDVSTHQLTGPDGMPLPAEQPSSSELAKALMFLFGEGPVVLPKTDQMHEIDGPQINGALIGKGPGCAVLPTSERPEVEPETEHSASSSLVRSDASCMRTSPANDQSETFANGAAIVFDASRQKFAVFDRGGAFQGWRREHESAAAFAQSLK